VNYVLENRTIENQFVDMCDFICDNYVALRRELKDIHDLITMTESYTIAYFNKGKFGAEHFKACNWKGNTDVLKILLERIEKIQTGAGMEFFQHVDFINIWKICYDAILREATIPLVWDIKKKIQYIIYEIDRIINSNDKKKQVAILKGVVGYY